MFLLACGTWGSSQGAISLHTFAAVALLVPVFPCHLALPSCCPWPASGPGEGHGCVAQGLRVLHDSTEKMRDRSEDISWALFFSPALVTFWLRPVALTLLHHRAQHTHPKHPHAAIGLIRQRCPCDVPGLQQCPGAPGKAANNAALLRCSPRHRGAARRCDVPVMGSHESGAGRRQSCRWSGARRACGSASAAASRGLSIARAARDAGTSPGGTVAAELRRAQVRSASVPSLPRERRAAVFLSSPAELRGEDPDVRWELSPSPPRRVLPSDVSGKVTVRSAGLAASSSAASFPAGRAPGGAAPAAGSSWDAGWQEGTPSYPSCRMLPVSPRLAGQRELLLTLGAGGPRSVLGAEAEPGRPGLVVAPHIVRPQEVASLLCASVSSAGAWGLLLAAACFSFLALCPAEPRPRSACSFPPFPKAPPPRSAPPLKGFPIPE